MNQDATELISRYVYHVGRHLPPERREDVARELLSLIGDRVDDELRAGESREAVVLRVLREMGPPEAVAARYGYERRLLIGAGSLPAFFRLVKVVPVAVLALSLLTLPYAGGLSASALGKWLLGYLNSVLLNLGVLVAVFVVLERLSSLRTKPEAEFDPAKLSPAPAPFDGGKLRPVRLVIQIYLAVTILVLFNFYPNVIGVWTNSGLPRFWAVPLSAVGIHVPLWLLNVWLAGIIMLKTEVLRQGSWTRETRWFQVGLAALGLAVLIAVLWSSHVGQLDAKFLASAGISPSDPRVAALARGVGRGLALAAAPLVLLILAGIARGVWRLSRSAGSPA
jgi:hypothetical protein